MSSYHEVERLKASGRYNEAFEIIFEEQTRHYHNFGSLYQTFKEYRDKCPSLTLSDSKRKEMYRGLCQGDWPPIRSFSEQDKGEIINDMERLGLIDEAIHALKKSCSGGFELALQPQKEHFKVADLYEKKRDWENATRIYEDYGLFDRAFQYYERSGKTDKVVFYLLGEGKLDEATAFYKKAGDPEKAKWVASLWNFRLEQYEHPLRRLRDCTPKRRADLYSLLGDEYHKYLEWIYDKKNWGSVGLSSVNGWADDILKAGDIELDKYYLDLLPVEIQSLLRRVGEIGKADQLGGLIERARTGCDKLHRYWEREYRLLDRYLVTGQFFKGIFVGEIALSILTAQSEQDHLKDYVEDYLLSVPGRISRCYEMLGAFQEAIEWKNRQLSASKTKADFYRRDLARLYLKKGDFAKAGEAFQQYCVLSKETDLRKLVLVAELYRWGEDRRNAGRLIEDFVERYRARGELPLLAGILENSAFFEEAATIYEEIGEKTHPTKVGGRAERVETISQSEDVEIDEAIEKFKKAIGEAFDGEDSETTSKQEEGLLLCSCGETLQPHWKLCPSCGKSVEMVCSCGEPLKAGWKLCPACGKKVSE